MGSNKLDLKSLQIFATKFKPLHYGVVHCGIKLTTALLVTLFLLPYKECYICVDELYKTQKRICIPSKHLVSKPFSK